MRGQAAGAYPSIALRAGLGAKHKTLGETKAKYIWIPYQVRNDERGVFRTYFGGLAASFRRRLNKTPTFLFLIARGPFDRPRRG